MKIFLDTANISQIAPYAHSRIIDGVTTNPTHLAREGGEPTEQIKKILTLMPDKAISVEVTEELPEKVYTQAKQIAQLGKNVLVKIPCLAEYYPIIEHLVDENVPLNITLVFTTAQVACMAKLGVAYISLLVGRWDDVGVDGLQLLYQARTIIDNYGFSSQLLAASVRTIGQFNEALLAGFNAVTIAPSLFEKAQHSLLSDAGQLQFQADWQKLGEVSFPRLSSGITKGKK